MKINNILLCLLLVIIMLSGVSHFKTREGFSYQNCISNGYTKSFCQQRPWPGSCLLKNGMVGTRLPGFGGKCVYSDYIR
jgi:hypothetical protein